MRLRYLRAVDHQRFLTVCPHCEVPPPRAVTATPSARQTAIARFGFLDRARRRHAERHDLVMRCVGGIAPARKSVEAHAAHLFGFEAAFESGHKPRWHVLLHAQK